MNRATCFIGLIIFAGILAGCEPAPAPVVEQPLRLALGRQPTSVLFLLAQEHGLFKKHGLNVELKIYPSGKRALEEGVLTGAADMANPFETVLALAVFDHPQLRVLASALRSDNISYIVARRDRGITQPGDLRGRVVATQSASAVHFFLHQFLLEYGLGDADVRLKFDKIEALPALLESGQVDAVSVREPFLGQCKEILGERAVIFAGTGIYEQAELLVATEKLLRERPAVPRAVLSALLEAEAYARPTEETANIVARYLDMNQSEVAGELSHYLIRLEMGQSLLVLLEELARWGIDKGLVHGEVPDFLDIVAPEAMIELAPERVTLIR